MSGYVDVKLKNKYRTPGPNPQHNFIVVIYAMHFSMVTSFFQ